MINNAREGIIQELVTIDALMQREKYGEAQIRVRNLIEDIKESGDDLSHEIAQAKAELEHARQNFEYATGKFIDIAINQLTAAESKLGQLLKKKADSLRIS